MNFEEYYVSLLSNPKSMSILLTSSIHVPVVLKA